MAPVERRERDQVHDADEDRDVGSEREEDGPIALRARVPDLLADPDEAHRVGRRAGSSLNRTENVRPTPSVEDLRIVATLFQAALPTHSPRHDRYLREREARRSEREPDTTLLVSPSFTSLGTIRRESLRPSRSIT